MNGISNGEEMLGEMRDKKKHEENPQKYLSGKLVLYVLWKIIFFRSLPHHVQIRKWGMERVGGNFSLSHCSLTRAICDISSKIIKWSRRFALDTLIDGKRHVFSICCVSRIRITSLCFYKLLKTRPFPSPPLFRCVAIHVMEKVNFWKFIK